MNMCGPAPVVLDGPGGIRWELWPKRSPTRGQVAFYCSSCRRKSNTAYLDVKLVEDIYIGSSGCGCGFSEERIRSSAVVI